MKFKEYLKHMFTSWWYWILFVIQIISSPSIKTELFYFAEFLGALTGIIVIAGIEFSIFHWIRKLYLKMKK